MNSSYFPADFSLTNYKDLFDFDNHSLVQFYHRNLAYLISIYIIFLSYYIYKKDFRFLYKPLILVLIFLFAQITLGIFTLVSGLNIMLASAHQIFSVLLVFSTINLYYFYIK